MIRMNDATRVAFLGLGAMGLPMCENILAAGFPLTVWNRTPAKADPLLAAGAHRAPSPRAAAENADVVLTCLPTQDEVRDVLTRPDGLLEGLTAGKILVDTSTIDPTASQELIALCAQRGIAMIEAPLSGGTIGAKSGALTMMIGGDAATLERVRPVLASMAKNIFHAGGPGMGQTIKLCNQMIAGAQTIALAEAYALLHAAGVDAKLATDIFAVSTANCVAIQQRVPVPGVQPNGPASNGFPARLRHRVDGEGSLSRAEFRAQPSTCRSRKRRPICSASNNRFRPAIASSTNRCSAKS